VLLVFNRFLIQKSAFIGVWFEVPILHLQSNSETASKKHKTPQFILEKRGALLDSIAMGIAPDI
jgi:hypothetical protein